MYASGVEPDPRFTLANERTYLAGIRTALALLAGAAALEGLDLALPDVVTRPAAAALAGGGLLTSITAWVSWWRTEVALRRGSPLPGNPTGFVVMLTTSSVGLALLATFVLPFE